MANYVKNKAAAVAVAFAGQSLNNAPDLANSYPTVMLSTRTTMHRYNVWLSGVPWSSLYVPPLYIDMSRCAKAAVKTVLIMVGGTTDCFNEVAGATTYATEKSYADQWRTYGGTYVIGTTTVPSTTFGTNTSVASGSNGVNTSTFAGAGTLNVVSTGNAPTSGTLKVQTAGTQATITYTGKDATSFTGCNTTAGGGVMSTGGTVRNTARQIMVDLNALVVGNAEGKFDTVVDLAADASLSLPGNATYYSDGVHWTATGASIAAGLIGPALDALVA